MKKSTSIVFVCVLIVFSVACGKKAEAPQASAVSAAAAETKSSVPSNAGNAIIDEILATFDQCVADAAALAKDKPETAVLLPQLEKLYAEYGVKMAALNARFLALRDQDIFAFRRANGYMTDNRPQHVHAKDSTLNAAYVYYNLEKGETAVVDMLSNKIVKLLDDAVKQ